MAEKRVSVRLAVVGGREVRAELQGVGEAGEKGFKRLSREMEAANERVAAFSRRVEIAAAAAAAAFAAAGVAMVRSGLQVIDSQAKLAASLGTTVESIQVLERAGDLAGVSMGEVEQATAQLTRRLSQAAAGAGPAAEALQRLHLSAQELQRLPLDQRIAAIQEALARYVPEAERAAVASKLFGDRAALTFLRIDTATLRTATQDVRDFGVVVSQADAAQIERTNDAISRLGLIWRGLSNQLAVAAAPALEAVADALAAMARTTGPLGQGIRLLFDNIGRLAAIATAFAGLMAGKFVVAMVAAAVSVRGLATALVFLRGALIRTGIGALVVAAGELIYQFGRLVQGAGGFREALRLLGAVAGEVWERIGLLTRSVGQRMTAVWLDLQAVAAEALQGTLEGVVGFADRTVALFRGTFDAVAAIWRGLPELIGDVTLRAANALIGGVEAMLRGVGRGINTFFEGINAALALLGVERRITLIPELNLERLENQFAGAGEQVGAAVREAFATALDSRTFEMPDLGLGAFAAEAREGAEAARATADALGELGRAPLASIEALREALRGSTEALDDAAVAAGQLDQSFDAIGGSAGGSGGGSGRGSAGRAAAACRAAASDMKQSAEEAATGWAAVREALAHYATDAADWGKNLGTAISGAFRSAEDALVGFVTRGKLDFQGLADSMLADITRVALRSAILGPLAGELGGDGGVLSSIFHAGGVVGGLAIQRTVPARAFLGAPRLHSGGVAGLRPDEVPAILQRGEVVLSRAQAAALGQARQGAAPVNVVMNISTPDANSFRRSQGQIAADAARAMERARRNL